MNNKEGFLKELQARIAVLEDAEQQDILAEYAQHIDLRVAGGLTEEEAIRDFGDLDQLAAEILEAYHVKPAFVQSEHKKRPSISSPVPTLQKGFTRIGAWLRRAGNAVAGFFQRMGQGIARIFHRCTGGLRRLFRRQEKQRDSATSICSEEASMNTNSTETTQRPIRSALGRAARATGRFCKAVFRLIWNLALLVCALPFACLGLAAILCIGILIVLLIQGYPLTGAVICCVGGALSCAGILGLGSCLVWRRPNQAPAAEIPTTPTEPLADDFTTTTDLICRTVQEQDEEERYE